MVLYIGNLYPTMTEGDLLALCSPHGSVIKINIIRDFYTRQSKCFGYVYMADRQEGRVLKRTLHGKSINDRNLVVKEARSRDERDGSPW